MLSFYLFTDDTNIYFKSDDLTHLQKIMNRELKKVKKWLDANRMALNIGKTNFVIFTLLGSSYMSRLLLDLEGKDTA